MGLQPAKFFSSPCYRSNIHQSTLSANAEECYEAWMKWHSITGVLWGRRINERLKSKIDHNVVRPVAIYGSECWPTLKDNEQRVAAMETQMLRWTNGMTRLDHIRNEDIRNRCGVAPNVENCEGGVFDGILDNRIDGRIQDWADHLNQ